MTWLPKSVVCLSYYDRFRFRSDAFAARTTSLSPPHARWTSDSREGQ